MDIYWIFPKNHFKQKLLFHQLIEKKQSEQTGTNENPQGIKFNTKSFQQFLKSHKKSGGKKLVDWNNVFRSVKLSDHNNKAKKKENCIT